MTFLTPLGLLGLLGIAALIIIYIIKPNYQNKMVSSTFVWKRSLKYRRKRIPISKIRNLLLIICQILIISLCAVLLAQPFIPGATNANADEKVLIIDASADMLTEDEGKTRFERAIGEVRAQIGEAEKKKGLVSVIIAGSKPSYLIQRETTEEIDALYDALDALASEDGIACSYGSGDVDGAMQLAADVLEENPAAEIYFYTATTYWDKGNVTVVNVSEESEWNMAILDCRAEFTEGYYSFAVDVACYNKNIDADIYCDVHGANYDGSLFTFRSTVRCENDETQTVVFNIENGFDGIYTYEWVRIYVEEKDSFSYDNSYYLYGGTKQNIKVQYYSSRPNNFFSGALMGLKDILKNRWDLTVDEVKRGNQPETEGYDLYVFEHQMPSALPTDGIVVLVDPDKLPQYVGVTLGEALPGSFEFSNGDEHPLTKDLDFSGIIVSEYTRVVGADGFQSLLYCGGDPILLVKNTDTEKIVLLPFSLNKSDLAVNMQFPILLYNIFAYFLPPTVENYVFDVDQTVALNARSPELTVTGPAGTEETIEEFPASLTLSVPGVYTLYQVPVSGEDVIENFYVKIPAEQSNIFRTKDVLNAPAVDSSVESEDYKLLIYFAAAMVALLFAEWILQSREQI